MNRFFGFLKDIDKSSRSILYTCFFAFFFNGLFTLMMGSFLPDLKMQYGLTETQSGIMLSGHSAGNLLAAFTSGLVPLLLGRRKSMVVLCSMATLGFGMILVSGNPFWLVLAFIFTGIGRGSVSNFNNGTVNQLTNGNPAASNILHAFFAVGALSAPIVFLIFSRFGGWQAVVAGIIVLGLLVAVAFSRMRFQEDKPSRKDGAHSSMVFVKNRSYLIFAGMMFFYLCAEYSINGWLVTYLQSKPSLLTGFAASQNAQGALQAFSQSMASLLWIIILVGRLTCAALSAKIAQKKLLLVNSAGAVVFFALLLFGESIPMVVVSVAGLGFCLAGICPMIYSDASYITNVYPMGTSTLLALGSIGAIAMPSIVGVMADHFGFVGGMASILVSVILLLVLALLNALLPPQPVAGEHPAQEQ